MKTGYLRKTQIYIILICFVVLGNGALMHYSYQETLQDTKSQRLSHAYQQQLKKLEEGIVERSALYKQYIVHPKSNITLADLQVTEQKLKQTLSHLTAASKGRMWDESIQKLIDLNQQFTNGATQLVRASAQQKETQQFSEQIDQLDGLLKNYIAQLCQIAEQADQLSEQDLHKQAHFFLSLNLVSCLIIIGLLALIYFSIGYRLRRSIISLTHALQDYNLFGASIQVFKQDRSSEMGQLSGAAQSFRDNVIENVIVHFRESHPTLFQEVGHVIAASKALKITVNEILDLYEDNEMKTKDLIESNEQTRITLRAIIKTSESFLGAMKDLGSTAKDKKIAGHLKSLESLIEQAHQAVVKEQNSAKRITTLSKMESKQKRIFELLLELSVKMGYISEQLEEELSRFVQVSPSADDDVIINRR